MQYCTSILQFRGVLSGEVGSFFRRIVSSFTKTISLVQSRLNTGSPAVTDRTGNTKSTYIHVDQTYTQPLTEFEARDGMRGEAVILCFRLCILSTPPELTFYPEFSGPDNEVCVGGGCAERISHDQERDIFVLGGGVDAVRFFRLFEISDDYVLAVESLLY